MVGARNLRRYLCILLPLFFFLCFLLNGNINCARNHWFVSRFDASVPLL